MALSNIARITPRADADNCLNIVGDAFDAGTSFWSYGQTTSGNGTLLELTTPNGFLLRRNGNLAQIALPPAQVSNSGFLAWPHNASGYGKPLCVNRAEAWRLQCSDTGTTSALQVTTYNAGTSYNANDMVSSGGVVYESIKIPNIGNTPASSPTFWRKRTVFLNAWNSGYTYKKWMRVTSTNLNYESLQDGNTNNVPPNATWWRSIPITDVVSAYGRNLMQNGSTMSQLRCRVFIEQGGTFYDLTPTSVNPYRVDFQLPVDIALGSWNVWLHNGHLGIYGWAGPLTLTVTTATSLGYNYAANVGVVGAPTGVDDFANFNNAISGPTPRTVVLNAGATYQLSAQPNLMAGVLLQGGGPQGTGAATTIKTTAAFNGGTMLNFDILGAIDNCIITTDAGGTFDDNIDNAIVKSPWRVTNCTLTTWQQAASGGIVTNRSLSQYGTNAAITRNTTITGFEMHVSGGPHIVEGNTFYQTGSTESPLGQLLFAGLSVANNVMTDLDPSQAWDPFQTNMHTPTSGGAGGTLTGTWWYLVTGINRFGESAPALAPPQYTNFGDVSFTASAGNTSAVLTWDQGSADYTGYKIYKSRTQAGSGQYTSPALVATIGAVLTFTDTSDTVSAGTFPLLQTIPHAYKRGQGRMLFTLSPLQDSYVGQNLSINLAQADNTPQHGHGKGEQMLFGEFSTWHYDGLAVASSPNSVSVDAASYAAYGQSNVFTAGGDLTSTDATSSPSHVTSASRPFTAADVNASLRVTGGSNFSAGTYTITGVVGNTAALNAACGTMASASGGTFDLPWTDLTSIDANTSMPHVTSVSRPFVDTDAGQVLRIVSGTNFLAQAFQILSVAGNVALLDRACGTAASVSGGHFQELTTLGQVLFIGGGKIAQDYRVVVDFTGGTYNKGYPSLNGTVNSFNLVVDVPWVVQPDTTSQVLMSECNRHVVVFGNSQSGNTITSPENWAIGCFFNSAAIDCVVSANSYNQVIWGIRFVPSFASGSWQQVSHILISDNSFEQVYLPVDMEGAGTATLATCCNIARNNTHTDTFSGNPAFPPTVAIGQCGQYNWICDAHSDINIIEHATASYGSGQPVTPQFATGLVPVTPSSSGFLTLYKNGFTLGLGTLTGSIGIQNGSLTNIVATPAIASQFTGYATLET